MRTARFVHPTFAAAFAQASWLNGKVRRDDDGWAVICPVHRTVAGRLAVTRHQVLAAHRRIGG